MQRRFCFAILLGLQFFQPEITLTGVCYSMLGGGADKSGLSCPKGITDAAQPSQWSSRAVPPAPAPTWYPFGELDHPLYRWR